MAISASSIHRYPATINDTTPASNGGRIVQTAELGSSINAVFPNITEAEQLSGLSTWRKIFITVEDAGNGSLIAPKLWVERGTDDDAHSYIYAANGTDTQDSPSGARPYGYGVLVSASGTAVVVTCESPTASTDQPFRAGDTLRISNVGNYLGEAGYLYEDLTIDAITYTDAVTASITTVETVTGTWSAGDPCASLYQPGDISASKSSVVATSAAGTFDSDYLTPKHGAIYQNWTLTITDGATGACSIAGDTLGTVGTWALGAADYSPVNANNGLPYFTISGTGFAGTWATNDTLTFTTNGAMIPYWDVRIYPADSTATVTSRRIALYTEHT